MSEPAKIRVAVMTRGDSMESWEVNAVKAVKDLQFAEIVVEIRDGSPNEAKSFGQRIGGYKWSRLFWNRWFRKYGKVDATMKFDHHGDNPPPRIFDAVPCHPMIPELRGKHSQYFSEKDIEIIKWHKPDVILRFGFNILRGEILTVAKYGVWSYHHADHETIRGGPAGFWEYILGHNITGAILQRLTDKLDDGIILRKGYWSLTKHSFRENLDSLLNYSSGWMANALTEIHHHGEVKPQNPEKKSTAKVYSYPGNLRMMQFWFILFTNKIAFHWENLFYPETWRIGVVDQPIDDIFVNGISGDINWIQAQHKDCYLADPSAIDNNGNLQIISEYYSYPKQRGKIVNAVSENTIVESPYHVSFPLVYETTMGQVLVAESSESGWLNGFLVKDNYAPIGILNQPVVDPVIVTHNGLQWLFVHLLDDQNNAALYIFYSEELFGKDYTPHALNPVKTDIRNSRSAGAIIKLNGKLFRPAQDSSRTYGGAIVINEITDLSPTSFSECEVRRIEPDPAWEYNIGIHTINAFGNQTLIDAKSFRFNFANFKAQFKRKSGRIAGR